MGGKNGTISKKMFDRKKSTIKAFGAAKGGFQPQDLYAGVYNSMRPNETMVLMRVSEYEDTSKRNPGKSARENKFLKKTHN